VHVTLLSPLLTLVGLLAAERKVPTESMIAKSQATRATNNTQITLSLKSLITNEHLSKLWNLERLEALIVSSNGLLALILNVKDWSAWVK
jgi:hypothetical protein